MASVVEVEVVAASEGLRERKKRETRKRISDIATGLFLERGFDEVTVAEVAKAADVSVNTVYNYFPSKEDLCLNEIADRIDRLARMVRERAVGESAACAVLRGLRADIERRDQMIGLSEGFPQFMRMIKDSPTLMMCLHRVSHDMTVRMAEAIAEAVGADPDDEVSHLIAWQITWVHASIVGEIRRRATAGESTDVIVPALLRRLDVMESLLSERVLTFATKC